MHCACGAHLRDLPFDFDDTELMSEEGVRAVPLLLHIAHQNAEIITLLAHQETLLSDFGPAISALTDAVTANGSAEESAIQLIQSIAQQIAQNATDAAAVTQLAQTLQDQASALGAAVVANTPAA